MIPGNLTGSYQRYKEDTNIVATWIHDAAHKCGYQLPQKEHQSPSVSNVPENPNNKLSQKERLLEQAEKRNKKKDNKKHAKKTEPLKDKGSKEPVAAIFKKKVSSRELLRQATVIAESGKITVPSNIAHKLRRAIRVRKRFAAKFASEGPEEEEPSTRRHLHFIGILEDIAEVLGLNAILQQHDASQQEASSMTDLPENTSGETCETTRLFEELEIEDQVRMKESSLETEPAVSYNMKSKPKGKTVYELEQESAAEEILRVFCFFEDLHRLRKFLEETWEQARDNQIDITTAAMITNLALDIVRREEIILTKNKDDDHLSHYELTLDFWVYFTFPKAKAGEKGRPLVSMVTYMLIEDFLFMPVYQCLVKFRQVIDEPPNFVDTTMEPPRASDNENTYENAAAFMAGQKLRFHNFNDFLSQYMLEMWMMKMHFMVEDQQKPQNTNRRPVLDELSQGFSRLLTQSEASTWLVFGFQVLSDIQKVFGDQIQRGWKELQKVTKNVVRTQLTPSENNAIASSGTQQAAEAGLDVVLDLCKITSDVQTLGYQTIKEICRKKALERFAGPKPTMHNGPDFLVKRMNVTPAFIYAKNPILCGHLAFNLSVKMEQLGMILESEYKTIFNVAHLYNASRQTSNCSVNWPQLDFVIESQKKLLFAGELPNKGFTNRFLLQMGLKPAVITKKSRDIGSAITRRGFEDGPKMKASNLSEILQQYYGKKEPMPKLQYNLRSLIHGPDSAILGDNSALTSCGFRNGLCNCTRLQYLKEMRDFLQIKSGMIKIDYLSLSRACTRFIRTLPTEIHQRTGTKYAVHSREPEWRSYSALVYGVLDDAEQFGQLKGQKAKVDEDWEHLTDGGPELHVSGKALDRFLRKEGLATNL
ncbi:hypothetical protein BJ875DRAFT_500356 [Amylocarpus encephaloides]|uniref:DUF6604 domain-containing protein n=1 Tax=Amylocarpus encephaloides TaxID=45428 RepID=A0A9P8C0J0_9HELO|nr:hypothetical protein BJ875DRAFT_500356 [Amylocarpus encephaloides]